MLPFRVNPLIRRTGLGLCAESVRRTYAEESAVKGFKYVIAAGFSAINNHSSLLLISKSSFRD